MPRDTPENPEEWGDEEWLEWLGEVDDEAPDLPEGHPQRPPRSRGATALGGAMVAVHNLIYGEHDPDVVMVIEADGDPEDPERLEVHLDPDDPDASTVTVRPWLEDDA